MDMSTHEKTQVSLFTTILEEGPLTLYAANAKASSPIGTIHRHFKEMEGAGWIKAYSGLNDTRRKIHYGPTLLGVIHFYSLDTRIQERLERYFLKWIGFGDFVLELEEEGFDVSDSASRELKSLFKKYVQYFAGVEGQIMLLRQPEKIPREILLYIGEFLLVRKPEYMRIWEELYKRMPVIRKNVDEYMETTLSSYNRLRGLQD